MECSIIRALDEHEPIIPGIQNMAINDDANAIEAEEYVEEYDPENPEVNNDDNGINEFEQFLNQ